MCCTKSKQTTFLFCACLYCTYSLKKELSAGLTREKSLEQSKAQLQLDWEGRMEEVERKAYGKHQSIIQQLTEAKDKVSHCTRLKLSIIKHVHYDFVCVWVHCTCMCMCKYMELYGSEPFPCTVLDLVACIWDIVISNLPKSL